MKVLATADLHLGRTSEEGHSAAGAWIRIVDLALSEKVGAVLIAGDLFDSVNTFYSVRKSAKEQFQRLAEGGIPVYMIAGNHDFDLLPFFHKSLGLESVHLLGKNGEWESAQLPLGDSSSVTVSGISFRRQIEKKSQVSGLPPDDRFRLALVHGDVGVSESNYHPIPYSELQGHKRTFWIVGHNHRTYSLEKGIGFYCGSPQALDEAETGPHGVYLLEIDSTQVLNQSFDPISSLRFENLPVQIEIERQEDFEEVAIQEIESRIDRLTQSSSESMSDPAWRIRASITVIVDPESPIGKDSKTLQNGITLEGKSGLKVTVERISLLPKLNLQLTRKDKGLKAIAADLLLQLHDPSVTSQHNLNWDDLHLDIQGVVGTELEKRDNRFKSLLGEQEHFFDPTELDEIIRECSIAILNDILGKRVPRVG